MRRLLLALAMVLSAAAAARAGLKIEEVRACHGPLGPERKTLDFYPSDEVFFRYRIAGVEVDAEGKVVGGLTVTFKSLGGEILFNSTSPVAGVTPLGGDSLPGTAHLSLPVNIRPGKYVLAVTFEDRRSGEKASFRRTLDVKAAEFAAIAVQFFYDRDASVAAPVGGLVGQTLHFRLKAIGFDRASGRIDVDLDVQVLDAEGRPMMPKPIHATAGSDDPDVVRQATDVTLSGSLSLNRAGDYSLRIGITDRIGKKSTAFETPLHVAEP